MTWRKEYNPNYSMTEMAQKTEKSLGELRIFVFSLSPVRNHKLTIMRNILK